MANSHYKKDFSSKGIEFAFRKYAIRELLMREADGGGLFGHVGITKTMEILKEHFYWLKMLGDVTNIVNKCVMCKVDKSTFKLGLYSPLSVLIHHWEEVAMDFIVALPHTQRGKYAIMVVVHLFPNWLILLLATKLMMLETWVIYTLKRLFAYLEFQTIV